MAAWSQPVPEADGATMELRELTVRLHRKETITPSMIDAMERHAATLSQDICNNFEALNAIAIRHEDLIVSRWRKKTVPNRLEILRNAWPGMPKRHRPDAQLYWEGTLKKASLEGDRIPDLFVWPFINQEDLAKPKTLPLFINSRGRKTPWEFASIEKEFSPVMMLLFQGCPDKDFCTSYTIDFTEATDPRVYGKLNRNGSSSSEPKRSPDKYSLCARSGFQILLMQQRILAFLHACSRAILHDKTEAELLSAPVQEAPPITELFDSADIKSTSFTEVLNIAPYQGWSSLNLSRLRGYVESTLAKHANHLWALREDPGYFADTIKEHLEHSSVHVPSDCNCHLVRYEEQPEFMISVITRTVTESYWMVHDWHLLGERLDKFDSLTQQGTTKQAQATPLLEFHRIVKELGSGLLTKIYDSHRSTLGCRQLFIKECGAIDDSDNIYHRVQGITAEQKEYLDLFETLRPKNHHNGDDHHFNWLPFLSYYLEQIELLLNRSETARRMISVRVLDLLTDLSILTECARQITLWLRSPDIETGEVDGCGCHIKNKDGEAFDKWVTALEHNVSLPLKTVIPLKERLHYPENQRRNPNTVSAMCKAEQNLDTFWKAIDAHCTAKTGVAQHQVIQTFLQGIDKMHRTTPWSDKESVKSEVKLPKEFVPVPNVSHDKASQFTGTFDRLSAVDKFRTKTKTKTKSKSKTKSKTKTSGDANLPVQETAIPMSEVTTPIERSFVLNKTSHNVMKTLFHVAANELGKFPKGAKWKDFTQAMINVGFAAEKLQGSAWQFTPMEDVGAKRSIQFHEPHPDSHIPYVMAKRFGRRLFRVYGWHGGMFSPA